MRIKILTQETWKVHTEYSDSITQRGFDDLNNTILILQMTKHYQALKFIIAYRINDSQILHQTVSLLFAKMVRD